MLMRKLFTLLCSGALIITACGSGSPPGNLFPARMEFPEAGQNGVFDPAPAEDGSGRIWMSYSSVAPSTLQSNLLQTSTRMAYSDGDGTAWTDSGFVINPATPITLSPPREVSVWQQEVSRIVYDSFDTTSGKPWKMVWHRHLTSYNSTTRSVERLFQHGWISLKEAASPVALKDAAERKLFAGSLYDSVNDVTIGPPDFRLDQLFPGADKLGECIVFTEPGIIPAQNGLFVSMKCAKLSKPGKVVLLFCNNDFSSCDYMGDLLDDSEASLFGTTYDGFSASELVQVGSQTYLIVTPTESSEYRGCLVFRVTDLGQDIPTLKSIDLVDRGSDVDQTPILVTSVFGTSGSFNGACGYTAGSTGSGIIYSEFFSPSLEFRLFSSGENLSAP